MGPKTIEARDLLCRSVTSTIARVWPEDKIEQEVVKTLEERVGIEAVHDKLLQLSPRNDAQCWLQSRAFERGRKDNCFIRRLNQNNWHSIWLS